MSTAPEIQKTPKLSARLFFFLCVSWRPFGGVRNISRQQSVLVILVDASYYCSPL